MAISLSIQKTIVGVELHSLCAASLLTIMVVTGCFVKQGNKLVSK